MWSQLSFSVLQLKRSMPKAYSEDLRLLTCMAFIHVSYSVVVTLWIQFGMFIKAMPPCLAILDTSSNKSLYSFDHLPHTINSAHYNSLNRNIFLVLGNLLTAWNTGRIVFNNLYKCTLYHTNPHLY